MKKRLITVLSVILTFLMLGGTFSFAANVSPVKVDQFTDVSAQDWYYDYVDFVSQNAYMIGTSETTFEPQSDLTRAMFATILARYDKAVVDDSKATIFNDVPVDQWYTGSIGWANENAIVQGYGDGKFGTNDPITRQDLALMIIRYIRFYEKEHKVKIKTHGGEWKGDITFTDESDIRQDVETPAAIKDLVNYGILLGYPDGTVKPNQRITRAETAAIIKRLDWILSPKPGSGSDQTEDYYYQVKATLTHEGKALDLVTEEYSKDEAASKTMDDVIVELISDEENQDAIIGAFESALGKVEAQEYTSGEYSVKINDDKTITATKNGKPVDLEAELNKEKITYEATMKVLKEDIALIPASCEEEWKAFVQACWVDNLFELNGTSATLKNELDYYEVLSNAVNAGVALHQALKDDGYDFAGGVKAVATWAETEKGIKITSDGEYTINGATVTKPTDVLDGTKIIGALNYEKGIVLDVLGNEKEHIVLNASETIPADANALMQLIKDRTSLDLSDHDGGFEAILGSIVSNGRLLGEYNVEVKVIKVKVN